MFKTGRPSKTERCEFGKRVYEARMEKGISQKEVADSLGITQQSYAVWERKSVAIKPDDLVALAKLLEIPLESLLGESSEHIPTRPVKSKIAKVFEEASHLPRSQQNKIIDLLEPFISRHKAS
tara:strand:- start:41 stop:409 length:369 start_codon:yes stop_codon:yes gene_type:complete